MTEYIKRRSITMKLETDNAGTREDFLSFYKVKITDSIIIFSFALPKKHNKCWDRYTENGSYNKLRAGIVA